MSHNAFEDIHKLAREEPKETDVNICFASYIQCEKTNSCKLMWSHEIVEYDLDKEALKKNPTKKKGSFLLEDVVFMLLTLTLIKLAKNNN